MKKIIAIAILILILTLYNYPIFDDKKITFAVIFLCFVVLIFSVAKLYYPDEKDYDSFEREMDRQHQYDGIFQYTEKGFYIKQKNNSEFIKWDEIISIYFFSVPTPFSDRKQSGLEIITGNKSYEFDYNVTPGIIKLEDQLSLHLPTWDMDSQMVIINNLGLEKTKLYGKNLF
ncbi:hypothetical protein EU348_01250 [Chryseobacterium indologenes]|uniref:Uncharacterized protein n=1 Tax=Chryseobacterium indologenes TaxID=253 RepID=A0A411DHJ3_CHRID|nr:hypothetical protein EU348_01250 [Chryseobacterium indologenes]